MIYNALNCIVEELNIYLTKRFNVQEEKAILNSILNQDGSIPEYGLNKVILSMVNLEHDSTAQFNPLYMRNNESAQLMNLPFNFNIDLLITSLFTNYDEGLKFLSEAIYFFHRKQVFNHTNTPGLDDRIQQLSFELVKLSYHDAHSLWGALGAKYMPSILFKIRMLSFQSDEIIDQVPLVEHTLSSTQPN